MERLDSGEALYGAKWQRRRRLWLLNHPLCRYCEEQNRVTGATVVDHIIPHRGNATLFWDETNWQSLCKDCHDSAKQSEEKNGYSNAVGVDGWPVDDRHPVNANCTPGSTCVHPRKPRKPRLSG
jgi:hypothetical protein